MNQKKYFIAIAGNIGIGKSSLTSKLAAVFGWAPYFEMVDNNPYLADFYGDMTRWSFHLQLFFLAKRFEQHKQMLSAEMSVIQDRSIYEDVEIFARNLFIQGKFDKRDYETYRDLFHIMTDYLKPPHLLVYLRGSVDVVRRRIACRGRNFEKEIPRVYLEQLHEHYENWIENYRLGPLLVIDTEKIDFVKSEKDFEGIVRLVKDKLTLAHSFRDQS